uniref:Olfactory receptor n=1 Tax=Periophthalmus magnuspinnatus TaxID=409849 RepID=A0A3B3Z980_9GOBI
MNFSVSTLHLDGVAQLYEHRLWLAFLFLLLYVFVMLSDSLVVYIVCSQRRLHQPMYVFVVAVLVNSAVGSTSIYPKLLWDLVQGCRVVQVSRLACLCQAFLTGSLGSSSFMLLSAMAFDRYLSICRPMRYAALMSPYTVTALLLVCWMLPACRVAGAMFLSSRLPICYTQVTRIYCDTYTFISMSCGGASTRISNMYGLMSATITIFLPVTFVLFSYGRILVICLKRSRTFSTKALNTCLPHILVFMNFSLTASTELLHRLVPKMGHILTSLKSPSFSKMIFLWPHAFSKT